MIAYKISWSDEMPNPALNSNVNGSIAHEISKADEPRAYVGAGPQAPGAPCSPVQGGAGSSSKRLSLSSDILSATLRWCAQKFAASTYRHHRYNDATWKALADIRHPGGKDHACSADRGMRTYMLDLSMAGQPHCLTRIVALLLPTSMTISTQ